MSHNSHHEHLLDELADQLKPVLENSPQAIYLYLDDEHKICNQKFADLLGYESIEQWVKNETPLDDVLESEQEEVIKAYTAASQELKASSFPVTLVKKDGSQQGVSVIMLPISYKNEIFVIHFFS